MTLVFFFRYFFFSSESKLAQARAASEGRMGYRGRFWEVCPCDVVWCVWCGVGD